MFQMSQLPTAQAQTDATVEAMFALAADAQRTAGVGRIAGLCRAQVLGGDPETAAAILFQWLQNVVSFKEDPVGVEALAHPDQILTAIAAAGRKRVPLDCKKLATLTVAILQAMKSDPILCVIKRPGAAEWQHVFACYRFPGMTEPVALDAQATSFPGQLPRGIGEGLVYVGGR